MFRPREDNRLGRMAGVLAGVLAGELAVALQVFLSHSLSVQESTEPANGAVASLQSFLNADSYNMNMLPEPRI